MLALALLLAQELAGSPPPGLPRVQGLAPGETVTAVVLPPSDLPAGAPDSSWACWACGRLLDARTGRPVAGATLETWTEDWDRPALRLASAHSGTDGSFRLPAGAGLVRAEKLLVRAPGYRSDVTTLPFEEELFLVPVGTPFEVRVQDLRGTPIEGARVRTHQTCHHGPPAVAGTTDAAGAVSFPDFPAPGGHADLEVTAPGFGGLFALSPRALPPALLLPRRRPLALRLVHADGTPAAGRRVVLGTAPEWGSGWTDAAGRVRLDALDGGPEQVLQVRDGEGERWLAGGPLPAGVETTLCVDGAEALAARWDEEGREPARLELVLGPAAGDRPGPWPCVLHERGLVADGPGPHRLAPGRVRVLLGGRFTGWREEVRELELAPGERRRVELAPEPERAVEVVTPGDGRWTVHLEAGDDSRTVLDARSPRLFAPVDEELLVVAQLGAEVHRARVAPGAEDARAVLDERTRIAGGDAPEEPRSLRATVLDAAGAPLAEARLGVALLPGSAVPPRHAPAARAADAPGTFEVERPAGTLLLTAAAPGCVPRQVEVGPRDADELEVRLEARATLRLAGAAAARTGGGEWVAAADGEELAFEELAPGPLTVVVRGPTGRAAALRLALAPGSERELVLAWPADGR